MQTVKPEDIRYRRDLWQLLAADRGLGGGAEIGIAEGNFAEEILRWPIALPYLYMVDRWKCMPMAKGDSAKPQVWHDANRMRATDRVAQFAPRVRILQMESVEAAAKVEDCTLSFVNIDADHSLEGVRADIAAWWQKLRPGGVIAFHDYEQTAYGVKKAVKEFAAARGIPVYLLPEDKEEDAGAFLIKTC